MAGQDLFSKSTTPSESSVTPTIDTSAYASGDLIGGKLTFSLLVGPRGEGYIEKLIFIDKAQQEADIDLFLFSKDPSNTTFTDQAAFAIDSADVDKVSGTVSVQGPADYVQDSNNSYATLEVNINIDGDDSRVYGALVSRGTPTYTANDDVIVKLSGRY